MKQILFLFSSFFIMQSSFAITLPQLNSDAQAIYGSDKREFITQKTPQKFKELAMSVAMVVGKDKIKRNLLSTTITASVLSDPEELNICLDERFAKNRSVPSCSAFLIGEDLMVSAGHCFMSEEDCQNSVVAFDVLSSRETSLGFKIPTQNIFECKKIENAVHDPDAGIDYAIIRLKKKVHARPALKLSHGSLRATNKVFMIGHPLGLAQIITNDAPIFDQSNKDFFSAALNSFSGNSGSPVFNSQTLEVEGLLIRGQEDFLLDSINQCYRYQVYDQANQTPGSSGEGITRISALKIP